MVHSTLPLANKAPSDPDPVPAFSSGTLEAACNIERSISFLILKKFSPQLTSQCLQNLPQWRPDNADYLLWRQNLFTWSASWDWIWSLCKVMAGESCNIRKVENYISGVSTCWSRSCIGRSLNSPESVAWMKAFFKHNLLASHFYRLLGISTCLLIWHSIDSLVRTREMKECKKY